jgi:periplasmic protein TonB
MLRRISLIALLIVIAMPGLAKADTVEEWRKQIATRLESNKRFPPAASDQRGTAKVSFVLDRNGKLVSHWLMESAGSRALDEESLAIIERAQPFPIPPPNLKEDQLKLAIGFIFATRPGAWEQEEAKLKAKVQSICRGC